MASIEFTKSEKIPYRLISAIYLVERDKNEDSTYDKCLIRLKRLADRLSIELPPLEHPDEFRVWLNLDTPTAYCLSLTLDHWHGWTTHISKC
jgi:hypothetical protein